MYKILIEDRDYIKYQIYKYETYEEINLQNIDPAKNKLFNSDVFDVINNNLILKHSVLQNTEHLPGVLMITGNLLGRKNNKFLYQCIPDDKRLPIFIVPYEQKENFNKNKLNRYVTFKFKSWNDKHPEGVMTNNLGCVEELNPYYEYQLYCKSLNYSLQQFTKDSKEKAKNIKINNILQNIDIKIKDRRNIYTFTIDSENTQDYDDAYSIYKTDNSVTLSIYISNVALILDTLDLWESFSKRICTIYLPDKKRPMIPTVLSSLLCTLKKDEDRICYTMDIIFENNNISIEFNNTLINVNNNFNYNDKSLNSNEHYNECIKYVKLLHKKQSFSCYMTTPSDFVSYLMMFMNYECSKIFIENKNGIFRTSTLTESNDIVPNELQSFIQILKSSSGIYTTNLYEPHQLMKFDSYIHITSPIRRLVDLLNSITLMKNKNLYNVSNKGELFYNDWISKLDYINTTSRIIRKLQYNCNLLDMFYKDNECDKIFTGYIFDKIIRNDKLYQYSIYIPSIKMVSKIISHIEYINYSKHNFSVHIFKNNENFKKKIRLNIIKSM